MQPPRGTGKGCGRNTLWGVNFFNMFSIKIKIRWQYVPFISILHRMFDYVRLALHNETHCFK